MSFPGDEVEAAAMLEAVGKTAITSPRLSIIEALSLAEGSADASSWRTLEERFSRSSLRPEIRNRRQKKRDERAILYKQIKLLQVEMDYIVSRTSWRQTQQWTVFGIRCFSWRIKIKHTENAKEVCDKTGYTNHTRVDKDMLPALDIQKTTKAQVTAPWHRRHSFSPHQ